MPRGALSPLALGLTVSLLAVWAPLSAQVAGRNVNMVSGGTFPGGDPFLQKQNEPSLAISTRNPCHLLAGANDYRAVNLEGLPSDREIGDAWLGWYESTDCGATWYSTLVPGYLQDQSPEGLASPVKGLSAGADPVVRSGAAGTFYYLFIAFNRGSNVGKLGLARAIDHNDRDAFIDPNKLGIDETGLNNQRRARSPIQYVGTTEMARGSSGQFIDKPSLAVFPGTGTCSMDGEIVPATNVYVAWTEFVGNSPENLRSKVYFARSLDCGQTLAGPATKLSEGYPIGQGTVIAVNPNNPSDIYVVWRQIRNDRVKDALLYARSTDGGRSFTKAAYVPGLGEGQFAPFDQNTTSTAVGSATTTFRTVAYPSLAFADDGFLYLAVSQVPNWLGTLGGEQARVTMLRTDGTTWTLPEEIVATDANGQQFMPALAYAAGKLNLIWYDVRFDEAERHADRLINEAVALQNPGRRRTIDLLGAQASLATPSVWPPVFQPYGVSQPDYNEVIDGSRPLLGPRISQYLVGDPTPNSVEGAGPRQLLFNRGNLLLYGGGTIPFMGDYIDIAPIPFVRNAAGNWVLNGMANATNTALGTFQAAWTDNRDAGIAKATTTTLPDGSTQLRYEAPRPLPANTTITNAECPVPGVDNSRTRDANVYTSRITQDFSLTLPTNAKPTNTPGVVRAFAVNLANNEELTPPPPSGPEPPETPTLFKLSLSSASASFSHRTFLGAPQIPQGCVLAPGETPVQEIFVNLLPRSSAARTVYVPCGTSGPIVVTATRMIDPATVGPTASVVINGDPSTPGAKGPDGSPLGPESHNPDAENPDAENPDAENPDAENPDAENPDAENPDAENPDAENPDAENPDAENPDAENPDAENPDAENANFHDVSVDVTNDGDTTSGYQVQVQTTADTTGYQFLLMGRRVYSTPTSISCYLVQKHTNQTLFAIPLAGTDLAPSDFFEENDSDAKHPTFLVRPGESIRVTLRIVAEQGTLPFCSADPTTGDCFSKLRFRTRAQAPNTGELEPREDSEGSLPGPDLLLTDGPLEATPATAGIGGFIDSDGVTIQNAGNQAASDFGWAAFLFSATGGEDLVEPIRGTGGLQPGGSIASRPMRVTIPAIRGEVPLPAGDYLLGIRADHDDAIEETNEDNNTITTSVTVQPYQVEMTPLTGAIAGTSFPYDVTVMDTEGNLIETASVTLSLEGPDVTSQTDPASQNTDFTPLTDGPTGEDGKASFNPTISVPDSGYRFIATVNIDGAGVMKFQSLPFAVAPSQIVVTNTNDTGAGSLHQAILDANARPGSDRISFDIPADGNVTIQPTTLLPEIVGPVTIDGTTQPGYGGSPIVELDGTNFSDNLSASGLAFRGGGSESQVLGLAITAFGQSAIRLSATDGVVIKGNYIGIDPDSGEAQGSQSGILLFGAVNTLIGGPFADDANLIGGHSFAGVHMVGHDANPERPSSSNLVQGNIIGLNPEIEIGGAPNGSGVVVSEGSFNNRIGGTADRTAQNYITGNTGTGVRVLSGVNNTIQYNRIDANGGLGIDLGTSTGITNNDTLDPDTGGNDLQNWPTLDSAIVAESGALLINGTLNSEPNRYYVIDFYASGSCGADANRQGRRWFGATIVETDASGNATLATGFGGVGVGGGQVVTATATQTPNDSTFAPVGSTSEFSNCETVTFVTGF